MKYVIFGAGYQGGLALNYLGYARVLCFVDNYAYGKVLQGKEVISFSALEELNLEDIIIVVANKNHFQEIEKQLLASGITKYFVFHEYIMRRETEAEVLPTYVLNKRMEIASYNRILSCNDISKFKKITVLGINPYIPYLLSEISIQNDYGNILQVISEDETDLKQCMGIPVVTWDEADKDFDCLIINEKRHLVKEMTTYENADGNFSIIDIYDADLVEPSFYHPELKKYKNMYKDKRIFVIGNGPSLTIEDLNTLHQHKEICIASNRLYKAYDQTAFRADFYIVSDQYMIESSRYDFNEISGHLLIGDGYHMEKPDFIMKEMQYVHDLYSAFFPNFPKFSEDISQGLYRGATITYWGLQLAAYLGAKEIYLIGIDHAYSKDMTAENNHFIKNYSFEGAKEKYKSVSYEADIAEKAYEAAEIYSKKHGFRIYNATRGGKLETFERVDFDSLFQQ